MPEQPFLRLGYTPDYADLFAVQLASRRYHYSARQRGLIQVPQLGFLAFAISMFWWGPWLENLIAPSLGQHVADWAPPAILIFVGVLFIWSYCYKLVPAASARFIAARKPSLPLTFTADDMLLRWESAEIGHWIKWSAIERMFLTKNAVCFLVGGIAMYIPLSAFPDAAERQAFITQAFARLSDTARATSKPDIEKA